ncbi:MAG: rhamnulose-1-phosphate aldolase [Candidatus Granulicatella sp. P6S_S16_bin.50.1]|nr:rhamnulose-1-phosphate aldolase [Candidatus Granulicatella sp. P6S_S16_bin.50.1]
MTYPDYIHELCHVTYDMWNKGWDEYTGGNVSYRLTKDEAESLETDLIGTSYAYYSEDRKEVEVLDVPEHVQGEFILITASGSQFRTLCLQPEVDTGIIQLTPKGYKVVAGFVTGKRPTSEIFMHILAHAARIKVDPEHRVVIHNHATNIAVYSLLDEVTSESLTLDLWSALTESIVVFHDGIAVLPWEVPGTQLIGVDTARELATHRLVVWAKHGVLSTGKDYQDCFGLIETADKAAHIALELKRVSGKSVSENNVLSKADLRKICDVLGVEGKYLND